MKHRIFGIENEFGILTDNDSFCYGVEIGQELLNVIRKNQLLIRNIDKSFLKLVPDLSRFKNKNLFFSNGGFTSFLSNGGRAYIDGSHFEVSTPECSSLEDLICSDLAIGVIVQSALKLLNRKSRKKYGRKIKIIKNNTDGFNETFGTHENYLIPREIDLNRLYDMIIPFLVTRQIYSGAGYFMGQPGLGTGLDSRFKISQRGQHIKLKVSSETTANRGIINTKDEPHIDSEKFRRLHLIVGDANMSSYASKLKVGGVHLVLRLMEEFGDFEPPRFQDPVMAIHQVAHNPYALLQLEEGKTITAIEIQEMYLEEMALRFQPPDRETRWLIRELSRTVNLLKKNPNQLPMKLVGKIDWVTKKYILALILDEEGLDLENTNDLRKLKSMDIEYHNLDRENGLSFVEKEDGKSLLDLIVPSHKILERVFDPPNSRALIRSFIIRHYNRNVVNINWSKVEMVRDNGRKIVLDLNSVNVIDKKLPAIKNLAPMPLDQFLSLMEKAYGGKLIEN